SSRRRHTRSYGDWSSDVCSSDLGVYDKAGRFVSSLDPGVFAVRENDEQQKIDLIARETMPTHMVLLVDNSQSMSRSMDFVRLARSEERRVGKGGAVRGAAATWIE